MYRVSPDDADDLPLVQRWLARRMWRNGGATPDEQFELVSGDLEVEPAMDQFIVATSDRVRSPICSATIRCLAGQRPRRAPSGYTRHRPVHRRGRHARTRPRLGFIRTFIEGLLAAGSPRVMTDPDPNNERAIRAYEKAGFRARPYGRHARRPRTLMVRDA